MSSVEIETLKAMGRGFKVDLNRHLRGRAMTAICAKPPSRIAVQSGHIRRALEQALG
jgi:hypothetical protein